MAGRLESVRSEDNAKLQKTLARLEKADQTAASGIEKAQDTSAGLRKEILAQRLLLNELKSKLGKVESKVGKGKRTKSPKAQEKQEEEKDEKQDVGAE